MPREVRCIGPSYHLNDGGAAIQRTVNFDLVREDGLNEDSNLVLQSAPGLLTDQTYTAEQVMGLYTSERILLSFTKTSGDVLKVYGYAAGYGARPASSGADLGWPTLSASFGSGTVGPLSWFYISIAHGQNQIVVVDGTKGWVLAYSDTDITDITEITAPGWLGSFSVSHLDGYFVFIKPNSEIWYWSAIDDASDLSALSFSSADAAPDRLVVSAVANGTLYLFGNRTCEPWVVTANATPFSRIDGARINVGCVGTQAVKNMSDGLVFVGLTDTGGPHVFKMNGYQPQKISNHAVDQALARCTTLWSTYVWTYMDEGVEYVGVSGEGLDATWVWNSSTGQWCERAELVAGEWSQHRVRFTAHSDGRTYAAGRGESSGANGKLYRMGRQYHTLSEADLVRERTWPHLVHPVFEPISYQQLELRCTSGADSAGAAITLEVSNDGGETFLSPLSRSLGTSGKPVQRVRWVGLGSCPAASSRVFRLRCSDDVPLTIQAAAMEAKG